jgi:hypothetical protein
VAIPLAEILIPLQSIAAIGRVSLEKSVSNSHELEVSYLPGYLAHENYGDTSIINN